MRRTLFVACLAVFTYAQTVTVADGAGNTVGEVLTTDLLGNPTTSTISTIAPAVTSQTIPSTTSAVTTAPTQQGQQGPVGQPQATSFTPGGTTPYTYTTVVNGVTTAVADVFTPTRPATQQPSIGASGTILDYSSWLSEFGPTTTASAGTNGAVPVGGQRSTLASTILLGLTVGMGLMLQ
ncbi:hypothetical protein DXG01_008551 [Tephrocybe rancida]|nr:hypothetical protein DXG01_008551 [Tephrocybe rancida]